MSLCYLIWSFFSDISFGVVSGDCGKLLEFVAFFWSLVSVVLSTMCSPVMEYIFVLIHKGRILSYIMVEDCFYVVRVLFCFYNLIWSFLNRLCFFEIAFWIINTKLKPILSVCFWRFWCIYLILNVLSL